MKNNQKQNCTHPVPKNDFGIFALHCEDNVPIELADLKAMIDGPIAVAEKAFRTEISKPLDLKKVMEG
jgi:hypothetical protein